MVTSPFRRRGLSPIRTVPDRLVTLVEEPSGFVRPRRKELRQLYEIVLSKYPQLGPHKSYTHHWASVSDDEHFQGFVSAFERLGFIGRTAAPDTKHYVDFWVSDCKELARAPSARSSWEYRRRFHGRSRCAQRHSLHCRQLRARRSMACRRDGLRWQEGDRCVGARARR